MSIKVVNKYKEPNHVYCGRGSALGNPFPMHGEKDRDDVCDQYEKWFYEHVDEINFLGIADGTLNTFDMKMTAQTRMLRDLFRQSWEGDINLGCFCAPKRCHCDTIKTFLDNKSEELRKQVPAITI